MLAAATRRSSHLLKSLTRPTFTTQSARMSTTAPALNMELPKFPLSPVPSSGKIVQNAACLIIGDEVLNGTSSLLLFCRY